MIDIDRATQFSKKAVKLMGWIDQTIDKFEEFGKISDTNSVEREFFVLLGLYESLYQAIVDAAKKLESEEIREQINKDREDDELLKYLRFARNSEVHDAVLKWAPSMRHLEVKVIEQEKINQIMQGKSHPLRLFCYLYSVNTKEELIEGMKLNPLPNKERCENAGVSIHMSLDCLSLKSFEIGQGKKKSTIKEPESHMGRIIPPSAWVCVKEARNYYKDKLDQIITKQNQHLTKGST